MLKDDQRDGSASSRRGQMQKTKLVERDVKGTGLVGR